MGILVDDDDSSIRQNHFDFNKVINTQPVQTTQKAETSKDHDR